MKKSRILLFTFLLVLHTGCMDSNKRQVQSGPLSYDQAIELAKQYLREGGYYKDNETVFWYDPKCSFWFMRYSNSPDALAGASKEFGLTRNYYAIFFAGKDAYIRDAGATVFIDKDRKRVIGVLYDLRGFVKNTK